MPGGIDFVTKEADNSLLEPLAKPNGLRLQELQRSAANVLRTINEISFLKESYQKENE